MSGPRPDPLSEGSAGPLRAELLAALEVCGLTGLAFTRPVLDSFGRSPETFVARGAERADVVLFALLVALVPAAVVALVGAATRLGGGRCRWFAHVAIVGLLGTVVSRRLGSDTLPWSPRALGLLGGAGGVALLALRVRLPATATFLRYLGAASAVFLVQFLALSPVSSLVTRGDDSAAAGRASAALAGVDDPPPVVVVIVDALSTTDLLDGQGVIDPELFPHLAGLADDATWYRNHTTTSPWTFQAVPAMLSGVLPTNPTPLPDASTYPENLFTLLDGTYDIEAVEQITRLCPTDVCSPRGERPLADLIGDAFTWWRGGVEVDRTESSAPAQMLPGVLDPDRGDEFARWIDAQDFSPGGRPGLWFYHLVMPHDPWVVMPDLSPYESLQDEPYGLFLHNFWGEVGADVAHQRQILQAQAVDRLLGRLFDALRAAGTYDETLLVVAGDHGQAYTDNRPLRGLTPEQYEQVAWTPLLVKAPGQDEGVVDDANVWNVDLVPTIADVMGAELPWDVDGVPAARADEARPPGLKLVSDSEFHEIEPPDGGPHVALDAGEGLARVLAADPVPGRGEWAVWQRTPHGDLVGREVDALATAGEPVGGDAGGLEVEQLDRLEGTGEGPPLLEVVGHTGLPEGDAVALAVNGTVAAVAPVEPVAPGDPGDERVVHALLTPDPFTGDDRLDAYLVDGSPGDATLRPLTVRPRT